MPEALELAVTGGSWRRLMCPECRKYIRNERDGQTSCGRCHRVYRHDADGWQEVLRDDQ